MTEQIYIRLRKIKAFGNRLCFYFCRIRPIQKNLIAVCTFEGKGGFGCNPKYIVEALHRRDESLQFIWLVNDMSKEFPPYIKKVPNTLLHRAYWLSRAKIWIDNYRKPYGTIKRKGQFYLNTWHGNVGFKSSGVWRGEAFSKMAYLVSKNDSDMIDLIVTDSLWFEEVLPKGLVYEGEILRAGAPRCDVLHGDRSVYREALRKRHGLPQDAKIVMFAPTYREGVKNGKRSVFSEVLTLDFARLLKNLGQKFGGTWHLCLRLHPQLAGGMETHRDGGLKDRVFDESPADDMYEVLAGVDAFVTDYSSASFDAGLTRMPIFLYADDIKTFMSDRGGMQWDFSRLGEGIVTNNKQMTPSIDTRLPFSVARTNEELEENIRSFNREEYDARILEFVQKAEIRFDGKASERVGRKIWQVLFGNSSRGYRKRETQLTQYF